MSTLKTTTQTEADAYAALATSQSAALVTATAALSEAQSEAQWAAARSAQLAASEASARRALEGAPLPSDAAAAALALEGTLVDEHEALAITLAAGDKVASAQAQVTQAQTLLAWATGQAAAASAAAQAALTREALLATQGTQLAAPPLSRAKADATAVLGGSVFTAAEDRLKDLIPNDDLRQRALDRAQAIRESAAADAAAVATAEDQLAAAEAAAGTPEGALAEPLLASARADARYRALLGSASEVARATGLLRAIADAPDLTQAEQDRFDDLTTDGEAALSALGDRDAAEDELAARIADWEDARATALVDHPDEDPDAVQAVVDALAAIPTDHESPVQLALIEVAKAEAAWTAARTAALATDPTGDPDTDPAVITAKGILDTARTDLTTAADASTMSESERADAGAWTAALPDRAWRAAVDFDDAQATLTAIKAIDVPATLTALRAAESTLADAIEAQGQKARAAKQLAAHVDAVRTRVTARATTQATRLLSATRGDG